MPIGPQLDAIDLEILRQLQADAKQTNQQLADSVSLSPSACLARVRRLEKVGVIARYRADVELPRIAPHVHIIAHVTLEHHRSEDFKRFDRVVSEMPEIVEAHQINGPFDYVLHVVCRDIERYREINDQLIENPLSILKIESHVALATTKRFTGYALNTLT